MKHARYHSKIALTIAIPFLGALAMHLLIYLIPMSEKTTLQHALYSITLTLLGLAIPFWMLKALFSAAHTRNRHEKEFTLRDIPKDKDELAKEP
jgi:hypothetical protein